MIRITIDKRAASREELSALNAETAIQAAFDRLAGMKGVVLFSVESVEVEAYEMLRAHYPADQITPEMVQAMLPPEYRCAPVRLDAATTMQQLAAEQQLSTLIAIKAAMSQGKRFDVICSELRDRSEGAVADAWQRCEMKLRDGNDYSKSLAATGLFAEGVQAILLLANDCKHWLIAIDAAIDYPTRRN